jgi:putative oxidoreductase
MNDHAKSSLQLLGRLLLCVIFVMSGYNKLSAPAATMAMMAREGAPIPEVAVVVAIVLELGGGLLLLFGLFCRWVAALLGVWCIATAVVAHSNFADINMLIHFWKNVAMAGGFAYVVAFGAGVLSLDAMMLRRRSTKTV